MRRTKLLLIIMCLICGPALPVFAADDESEIVWQPPPSVKTPVRGGMLIYDAYNTTAVIKFYGGRTLALSNEEYPSIGSPAVSPDQTRVAYLEPYGFEVYSNIYILDIVSGTVSEITIPSTPYAYTAKQLAWLSDTLLLLTIGFGDGTVTMGGDLYYYDFTDGSSAKIVQTQNKEINSLRLEKDTAYLRIIGSEYYFTVKNYVMILRDDHTEEIPLNILRYLIERQQQLVIPENPITRTAIKLQCVAGWLNGISLEKHGVDPVAAIVMQGIQ